VYLCVFSTVYVFSKKVLGNIRKLHGLGVGLGLEPSYYPVIVITIIST